MAAGDPNDFTQDISRFCAKTRRRADLLQRAIGIKLFSAVIKSSPVGSPKDWKVNQGLQPSEFSLPFPGYVGGRFRGNWRASRSRVDRTATGEGEPFPSQAQAVNGVLEAATKGNRKQELILANSLPYGFRLEHEGWSGQAPEGMVRVNVTRFRQIIREELAKLKRSGQ
jgi:hypothetical protein